MNPESELSRLPFWAEKTGPHAASLKKLLRRAARLLSKEEIDDIEHTLPVFREGGRLAENRKKGGRR